MFHYVFHATWIVKIVRWRINRGKTIKRGDRIVSRRLSRFRIRRKWRISGGDGVGKPVGDIPSVDTNSCRVHVRCEISTLGWAVSQSVISSHWIICKQIKETNNNEIVNFLRLRNWKIKTCYFLIIVSICEIFEISSRLRCISLKRL